MDSRRGSRWGRNSPKCLGRVAIAETVLGWQVARLCSRQAIIGAWMTGAHPGEPLGERDRPVCPWRLVETTSRWNNTRWALLTAAR
jgi:hypothetical protein